MCCFHSNYERWTKKINNSGITAPFNFVWAARQWPRGGPPEDEEVAWVLEVVGCKRSHLGDMSEDEFRYIYSNEYHVVLVGDSRDPFAFFFFPRAPAKGSS